jgi:hypothetical protein
MPRIVAQKQPGVAEKAVTNGTGKDFNRKGRQGRKGIEGG